MDVWDGNAGKVRGLSKSLSVPRCPADQETVLIYRDPEWLVGLQFKEHEAKETPFLLPSPLSD